VQVFEDATPDGDEHVKRVVGMWSINVKKKKGKKKRSG
jgi:hypothetical protein